MLLCWNVPRIRVGSLSILKRKLTTYLPSAGHLSIPGFLHKLQEVQPDATLMVEGGARVISSLLQSGLVDTLIVTVAPTLVGAAGVAVVPSAQVSGNVGPHLR